MNTNRITNQERRVMGKFRGQMFFMRALACAGIALSVLAGRAANLTWDADGAPATPPNPADGSGDWLTGNGWWNGTADVPWTNGNGAIFGIGSGTTSSRTVTVSAPVVVTNILFQTPGSYVVTGTQITFSNATSGLTELTVNAGQTAEIDSFIVKNGGASFLNNGGTLILGGGGTASSGQSGAAFVGASATTSTNIISAGQPFSEQGSFHMDNITVIITNAAIFNDLSRIDIGRNVGPTVVNVGGSGTQMNANTANNNDDNANIQVSRGQRTVLNIYSGATVSGFSSPGTSKGGNLTLIPDSSSQATVNIFPGATVNVGTGAGGAVGINSTSLRSIRILTGAMSYGANAMGLVNMSGGSVTAQNITFGAVSGGTYTANPTNIFNLSGGTLYLGNLSIIQAVNTGTKFGINLSGGTIAAVANWSPACSVPLNLTGNVAFQAADAGNNPFSMALSGPLTGAGGFNKTGGGVLILSGANNYTGTTIVSNGTLAVSTTSSPTNGPVIIEGGSVAPGSPTNSVIVANVGQHWTTGTMTYDSGTPTADFNLGSFAPSTTVAPIQINGDLVLNVTPVVSVEGSSIATGTYPLITYTGALSGSVPTAVAVNLSGGSASGFLTNLTATKTISLVVTSSTFSPALSWKIGNGIWDTTTSNWLQFGVLAKYVNGDAVLFDDTASGPFPIAVTLNTSVNPASVQVNTANTYAISGTGAIAGGTGLEKDGTGVLTLAGSNTYSGGTVLNAGTLNINYGGDGAANSAIGTGPLTIKLGSKIDNTSGSPLVLKTPVAQFWNDDFTFVGSSSMDMGLGQVTLGSAVVTVTVAANSLTVNNQITDNNNGYAIAKAGNGTLTLSNLNTFSGGVTLSGGQLNINSGGDGGADSAIGTGVFTISGNSTVFDNTSGAGVVLQTAVPESWFATNFTFIGTGNLDLGPGNIALTASGLFQSLTVVSNTLSTEGALSGNNRSLVKLGGGTLVLGGPGGSSANDNNGLGIIVNAGQVLLAKAATSGICHSVGQAGLTVNSNAFVMITGAGGDQIADPAPVLIAGGILDLNGQSETMNSLTISNGTLRNSAAAGSTIRPWAGGVAAFTLAGTNYFDVASGGSLIVNVGLSGTGALLMTNAGGVTLLSNNTYTADTIVGGGTLSLVEPGSISNSATISVHGGATLDATGRTDQTLTLNSGQTTKGDGTIIGNLVALAGSTVAPGPSSATGTLTVSSNVTLGGSLFLKLNRTNAPTSDKLVSSGGVITYGGVLNITNIGPALQVGDQFQIFPAAVTTFAAINLPATDASGNAYTWNNKIAVDGSIQVSTVGPAVNPLPGSIHVNLSGNFLSLAWPTNAGWILQTQTNGPNLGLTTNWVTVAGSTSITSTNIAINPANGSVFYRLKHP